VDLTGSELSSILPPSSLSGLAERVGAGEGFTVTPLAGGQNNRVFRLDADGRRFLLKAYFRHPADPRDRLGAEFDFLRYAWDAGIRCIAEPLARDDDAGLGLYGFVAGRTISPAEADAAAVGQAADFVAALNRPERLGDAARLSPASEACFSLDDHLQRVNRRVGRLELVTVRDAADAACLQFVRERLRPAWEDVRGEALSDAERLALAPGSTLPPESRVVSPSDFGFHNALRDGTRIHFLDFEYAGWDDPAKLICDFFCQPAVPAPTDELRPFCERVLGELYDPSRHWSRVRLLLPVYRMKWCCILLNNFLPGGRERRRFALGSEGDHDRRARQLRLAEGALAALNEGLG
jgi:hypothetical protein